MSPNDKTKKSATMNETDTNKLFLDIEKKESIQKNNLFVSVSFIVADFLVLSLGDMLMNQNLQK